MDIDIWKIQTLRYINKKRKKENTLKVKGKCLNLGCGNTYIKGYVNVDYNKKYNPDIVWNLNKYPYPFKDNEFDFIYCSYILEHLDNLFKCLKELRRIIKPNGIIHIRVPYFSYSQSYADITHKRFFGAMSFRQLIGGEFKEDFSDFEIIYDRINFLSNVSSPKLNKFISWFFNHINWIFYERFLCWILPVTEVEVKIRVEKDKKS